VCSLVESVFDNLNYFFERGTLSSGGSFEFGYDGFGFLFLPILFLGSKWTHAFHGKRVDIKNRIFEGLVKIVYNIFISMLLVHNSMSHQKLVIKLTLYNILKL